MPDEVLKTVLPNGVRIVSKRMPGVRSASMGVWVNVGARDETREENGLSHFVEHMIFKGTQKRSAYQIAKAFDAIGGHTNAFTAMESTCYHARVVDTHLKTMIAILADIFLNSTFESREIERERPVIFQEIGMIEDSPDEWVHQMLEQAFWGDNPLGRSILGTRENVIRFTRADIRSFFKKFYRPDRIIVSAAGNIDHDRICGMLSPWLSTIRQEAPLPDRRAPESRSLVVVQEKPLEQVHLCLGTKGISVTDDRRYALALLNTILGGNMSSRLFQEIREKRGLAYMVYSFANSHSDSGMVGVTAATDPKKAVKTLRLVLRELNGLKIKPVSKAALMRAKEYVKSGMLLSEESVDNQMVRLSQGEMHFGCYRTVDDIIQDIEAVDPEAIQQLAVDLFQRKTMALTVLGPVADPSSCQLVLDAV